MRNSRDREVRAGTFACAVGTVDVLILYAKASQHPLAAVPAAADRIRTSHYARPVLRECYLMFTGRNESPWATGQAIDRPLCSSAPESGAKAQVPDSDVQFNSRHSDDLPDVYIHTRCRVRDRHRAHSPVCRPGNCRHRVSFTRASLRSYLPATPTSACWRSIGCGPVSGSAACNSGELFTIFEIWHKQCWAYVGKQGSGRQLHVSKSNVRNHPASLCRERNSELRKVSVLNQGEEPCLAVYAGCLRFPCLSTPGSSTDK